MEFTICKASLLKRISAGILDIILLAVICLGFVWALSAIVNYDYYYDNYKEIYSTTVEKYGFDLDNLPNSEKELTKEEKVKFEELFEELNSNEEFYHSFIMGISLSIISISIGILLGIIIYEFVLPLIFKDGQTVGKKIFGIIVLSKNGVRIKPVQLFIRTILGKYTIEIMIPILTIVLLVFGNANALLIIIVIILCIAQFILFFFTYYKTPIHDLFAQTITCDKDTQMMFDTYDDLMEYKKQIHKEIVEKDKY